MVEQSHSFFFLLFLCSYYASDQPGPFQSMNDRPMIYISPISDHQYEDEHNGNRRYGDGPEQPLGVAGVSDIDRVYT